MLFEEMETERLYLKNISSDDRDFLLKQFSDESVNAYLFDAEPMETLAEADELIAFYTQPEPREQHRWILVSKENGEKIGTCGFHCLCREEGCVDLGYDLQKAYWGKGLMTEAVEAVLKAYLPKIGATRVFAHIAVGNTRSIRLAEKLGFVFEGETETLRFHGADYLHNIYVLHAI